jgi:DNA replication protein DnaC
MLEKCYTISNGYRNFDFMMCIRYMNHLGRQKFNTSFSVDPNDREILHKLIAYAIGEEELCTAYDIDLNKGILLTGPVGCGKTSLISLLPYFMQPNQKYMVKNTREIASEFHKEGYEIIQRYGFREKPICIDDLGVEQNIKHFGNECNTIGEIMLQRYELQVSQGIITHATTNLNADELEDIYGIRVRSRLRTMFNLISFPEGTNDKRK